MADATAVERLAIVEWGDHLCLPDYLRDRLDSMDAEVVVHRGRDPWNQLV